MSQFNKGDKVVCVNSIDDLNIGDILIVEIPETTCCHNIKFVGSEYHYPEMNNFKIYEGDGEPRVFEIDSSSDGHVDGEILMIPRVQLFKGADIVLRCIIMGQMRGFVPAEMVRDSLIKFMLHLGVEKEYANYLSNG